MLCEGSRCGRATSRVHHAPRAGWHTYAGDAHEYIDEYQYNGYTINAMTKQPLAVIQSQSALCGADAIARQFPGLERAARQFRALADETRLAILKQLRVCGEMCACDFVACCGLAQPTVSHHLKVLREAGLVETDKRGQWVYYRLNAPALEALRVLVP